MNQPGEFQESYFILFVRKWQWLFMDNWQLLSKSLTVTRLQKTSIETSQTSCIIISFNFHVQGAKRGPWGWQNLHVQPTYVHLCRTKYLWWFSVNMVQPAHGRGVNQRNNIRWWKITDAVTASHFCRSLRIRSTSVVWRFRTQTMNRNKRRKSWREGE